MKVVLGTAQLGMAYGIAGHPETPPESEAFRILDAAYSAGVRRFDTAPAYGEAEARLGRWRRGKEVRITTKLAAGTAPDASLEASRRRAGEIDQLLIHAAEDLRLDVVEGLLSLRAMETIGSAGASIYAPAEAERIGGLDALQIPHSVFDRRIDPTRFDGIEIQIRSVLLQGLLGMAPEDAPAFARPHLRAYAALCADHGVDPVTCALAYAFAKRGADRVVVGVDSPAQLEQVLAAAEVTLPAPLVEALEARFAGLPEAVIDPRRWPRLAAG